MQSCAAIKTGPHIRSSINAFVGTELDFTPEEREELLRFNGDAQTVADEITVSSGEVIPVFGDVSKKEDVKRLADTTIKRWGRIDIIVYNAFYNWVGNILDMNFEIRDMQIISKQLYKK